MTFPHPEIEPIDDLDAAMEATLPPRITTVFGELQVSAWAATWEDSGDVYPDGKAKRRIVVFDPAAHKPEAKIIQIEFCLIPTRGQYNTERKMIDRSPEFVKIVLPSLKALGVTLKSLNGQYVKAELVPTGKAYIAASGEEKQRTTFKFLQVFDGMESCMDAAADFFRALPGGNVITAASDSPAFPTREPVAAQPAGMSPDAAWSFVDALWTSSGKDAAKFRTLMAGMGTVTAVWPLDSERVKHLIGG